MLKEFLEYLSSQAVKAARSQIVPSPHGPPHEYFILKPDGEAEAWEAPPHPREHLAGDLDTIVAFAERFGGDNGDVAVWCNRKGVTLLVDDETRRDRVDFSFGVSVQLQLLVKFEAQLCPMSPGDFGRLLRVTFDGCLGRCPSLPEVVKRVKFRVDGSAEVATGHTKASIGRSLEQEVTGTGSIPEYVDLDVPVFSHPVLPWTALVRCALEADAATQKFTLLPIPGSTERAIVSGEDALHARLVEAIGKNAEIYRGTP